MFVKPAPGLIVRDPLHMTPVPPQGREVPDISYWHKRVLDGDLIVVERAADVIAPTTPAQEQ